MRTGFTHTFLRVATCFSCACWIGCFTFLGQTPQQRPLVEKTANTSGREAAFELNLNRENSDIGEIILALPAASTLVSGEVLLHLLQEQHVNDDRNKLYLLSEAYSRSVRIAPRFPLLAGTCDGASVEETLSRVSKSRNRLKMRISYLREVAKLAPDRAVELATSLFSGSSYDQLHEVVEGHTLIIDTDRIARDVSEMLLSQQHLFEDVEQYLAHVLEVLEPAPSEVRLRTLLALLLSNNPLPESSYDRLISVVTSDLGRLDFDGLRRDSTSLSLTHALNKVTTKYPNDPSLLLAWTAAYDHSLFGDTTVKQCEMTAPSLVVQANGDVQSKGTDTSSAPVVQADLVDFYLDNVVEPSGFRLPTKETREVIKSCLSTKPQSHCEMIQLPPGVQSTLRPLFHYKAHSYGHRAPDEAPPDLTSIDSAVNAFTAALDQALSTSDVGSTGRYISVAISHMFLADALSGDLWIPRAWRLLISFFEGRESREVPEYLWMTYADSLITMTSAIPDAEAVVIADMKQLRLVPNIMPLQKARDEAIQGLRDSPNPNVRLIGLVQAKVPFAYSVPVHVRNKVDANGR